MYIQSLDIFYNDGKYVYSFANPCAADKIYIVFSNGKIYSVKDVIKNDKVNVEELIKKGIKIYKSENN